MEILILIVVILGAIYYHKHNKKWEEEQKRRAAQAASDERERQEHAAKVFLVTRSEFIPGYEIEKEIAWVKSIESLRSDAEFDLKVASGARGGNAVTKLHFDKETERYQAGVGPKGNPYYQSRVVTTWQGLAVIAKKKTSKSTDIKSSPKETSKRNMDEFDLVVLDGSNIAQWGEGFEISRVRILSDELTRKGKIVHVFFDANVGFKLGVPSRTIT